jgi:thiosulfate dehydrogenase
MEEPKDSYDTNSTSDRRGLPIMVLCIVFVAVLMMGLVIYFMNSRSSASSSTDLKATGKEVDSLFWLKPDTNSLGSSEHDKLIKYGRNLIARTSYYLGPRGVVKHISNGMNCQNCHLDAGTKIWGNNYSAVASTYPRFRERSGSIEDIYKRVNDCIERSLNGTALDTASREMQAIKSYILWLGKNVKKGVKPTGVGITDVAYLERAADPEKGKIVYAEKCSRCHGEDGDGKSTDSIIYPPLWGKHSYNIGAGIFRLSRFAGYVKSNMPFGTNHDNPQLTDEEAWDVAAFVNSQPRPSKDLSKDWPRIAGKPIDHPFGPYADGFSEAQHKYGPFGPIAVNKKKMDAQAKK